jgi:hypothetical protein
MVDVDVDPVRTTVSGQKASLTDDSQQAPMRVRDARGGRFRPAQQ